MFSYRFGCLAAAVCVACASVDAAPIMIDISSTSAPGTRTAVATADGSKTVAYNEIAAGSTTYATRNTIADMVDTSGNATGIALNVLDVANGPTTGSQGTTTTDFTGTPGAALFPTAVMQSFRAVYNSNKNIDYAITGLKPSATYDFDFLCNRNGTSGTTVITLAGLASSSGSIATSDNTSLLSFDRIAPDATGRIVVYVSSPGITSLYAPLNVFQFAESVPEPATLSLMGLGAMALLRRRHA